MTSLRSHLIDETRPTSLRVGIKWDPLERDDIEECYALGSAEAAQREIIIVTRQIKRLRLLEDFLRWMSLFGVWCDTIERLRDQKAARLKTLRSYIAQAELPSYDLDLCCFCYDQNGHFVDFVSPILMETKNTQARQPAFIHSGDDTTGTGDAFDEEILTSLNAIDPAIHQVFFIVVSINHGFDQVKGGFWSIVNTRGESEIMSTLLRTQQTHKAHVMAKLSRHDTAWLIEEIADYCPLDDNEKIPLHQRIDRLLSARYLGKTA